MDASMAMAAWGMAQASASLTMSASRIADMPTVGSGASVAPVTSGTISAPLANLQGMVTLPADPVAEAVNQMSASLAFRANLAVFEAASRNVKTLLDTLA